ncbi:MAG: MFS transporter, partial [Planctomycetes bacterium]|nr:MFS transporter [Planctomycetota bacterium]
MDRPGLGLRSRGFLAYLATQCVSALTDNAYKFLLLGFLSARAAGSLSSFGDESSLTQALFAAPFVLLAPWAGVLADRVRKSTLLVVAMASELLFMLATGPAFATGSLAVLLALVALSSVQSTFFSPAKYGFLPEMVHERDLTRANGLVNMTTFAAIIVGQVLGGMLYDGYAHDLGGVSLPLGAIGALGFLAALAVPRTPAGTPTLTFGAALRELRATFSETVRQRPLLYTVLGIGHFYMLAAVLQISLLAYGEHALGLDATGRSVFVGVSLVGIALGSLLAAAWSGRHIELGLVPLGALGTSVFLFALAAVPAVAVPPEAGLFERLAAGWPACACVLGLGASAGLFSVPLNANLQVLAPEGAKGRFLAFGNMASFVGVFLAAGGVVALGQSGLDVFRQALAIGVFSLAGTLVSLWLLPEAFLRLMAWALAHTVYRIRVLHVERLPERGGALLVANHVSWVDWLILSVITRRKIRFLIQRQYFEWRPINWLLRLGGCIPVASGDAPEVVAESLSRAGEQLARGHLVGIFAEGTITRTGHMQTIRRGYQRIVAGRGVPIVPVYLDGLWGSVFSHEGGRFLRRLPRRLPFPVTVVVGEPLPADAQPWHLRAALQRLSAQAFEDRRRTR